jgi:hypothetical protein
VDPWLSAGVTYVHDGQSFSHPAATSDGGTARAEWQLDSHAIGIPLALGVDWRVTKALSIGPSFEYVIMNPIAGCAKMSAAGFQGSRMCTDNDATQRTLVADAAGAFHVGLGVRLTPF